MHIEPTGFRADEISASLSESEQRYRLLFERAPAAMYVFDVETLRILAVNDAALARYGYSREEFLALTLRDLRPSSELARFWRAFASLRAGHEVHGAYRHRTRGGEIFDVEITTRALPIGDGRLRVAIAREITGERRAEDAAHYLDGATRLLTSALDESMICRNLAAVAVSRLGTWCAVHCLRDGGALRLAGFTHGNPLDETDVGEVVAGRALGDGHPVPRAARSQRTVVLGPGDHHDTVFGAGGGHVRDPRLSAVAALYVPIRVGGRVCGVMECVAADVGRAFAEADVALAEELASRAGMAMDNARLYAHARRRALPRRVVASDRGPMTGDGGRAGDAVTVLSAATVLESMRDGFIAVDGRWRITYANRGAEHTLHCPREEMIGSSLWALFPGLAESEFGVAYRRAREQGHPVNVEGYYRGLGAWFDVGAYPVQDGLLLFFRDTSEGHVAREEADSLDHALRDCLEDATDLVHMIAPDGRVLFANAAWRETLGYTAEEAARLTVLDVVPPEWHERLHEARAACLAGHPLRDVDFEVVARDGRRITVRGSVRARIVRGEPVATFGIFRDVTAERAAEAASRRADRSSAAARRARTELLRRMSHSVRTPLNAIIGFAQLIEQNADHRAAAEDAEFAARITRQGYQLLELVEDVLAFAEIEAHRAEHEVESAALDDIVEEIERDFAPVAARQGARIETRLPPTIAPLATDAAMLRRILRALVADGLRRAGAGGVRIVVGVDEITGAPLAVDVEVASGAEADPGRSPDLGVDIARSMAAALGHELTVAHPAPGRSRARLAFSAAPRAGGGPAAMSDSGGGEALASLLHTVIDASPLAIIVYDPALTVRLWNGAAERTFGWSAREVTGRRLPWDAATDAQEPSMRELLREALHEGAITETPVRRQRKDGRVIDVHVSIAPLRDADGTLRGFVSMAADVTEKRRVEEDLRQAQKMEVVGRFAGGIAHDFNNLLTVIRAYSAFLVEDLAPADPRRADAEEIVAAVDRAAALTRQLTTFARRDPKGRVSVDVAAVVGGYAKMLRRLVPSNIDVAVITTPDPCHATMDPTELEQVVMNLVLNARDAMPGGGTLVVEVDRASPPGAGSGAFVRLTVSDTGPGMDAATRARVFEPFFTTKAAGHGTGLGLATVREIVGAAGGAVEVESEPGEGTTFRVLLPLAAPPDVPQVVGDHEAEATGTETVLLVEDQDPVRAVAARMLRSRGYTVLTARHGHEALELATTREGRIHVVVSDLVMPEMDGYALAARLRQARPDARFVFISGYSEPPAGRPVEPAAARLAAESPLVSKPLTADALARAVRQALAGG